MLSRGRFALAIGVGVLLGLSLRAWPPNHEATVGAWEASGDKFRVVLITTNSNDRFYNYDNTTTDNLPPQGDQVDNALTMVFTENATSVKVRNKLEANGYPDSGGDEHERLRDESSFVWSTNKGRKGTDDCNNWHLRWYSDPDGDTYDPTWGFWVLASTHKDENECFPWTNQNFGWGEQSEDHFEDFFDAWWTTHVDEQNFYNNEPYREECGTGCFQEHFWDNNNLATRVEVP